MIPESQFLLIDNTGLALLLLGLAFIIAEAFIFTFGVLALVGIIAFTIGSVLLVDTNLATFGLTWPVMVLIGLTSILFLLVCINLAIRSFRKKVVTGREALIGAEGTVLEIKNDFLVVRIQGEIWKAQSERPLAVGQKIRVVNFSKLLLTVEPNSQQTD